MEKNQQSGTMLGFINLLDDSFGDALLLAFIHYSSNRRFHVTIRKRKRRMLKGVLYKPALPAALFTSDRYYD